MHPTTSLWVGRTEWLADSSAGVQQGLAMHLQLCCALDISIGLLGILTFWRNLNPS